MVATGLMRLATLVSLVTVVTSAANKPNLIFILQDDLGHFDTTWGGNPDANTTNLGQLASSGVILDRFYVHWHCSPTRRAFLTGRLPLHHGETLSDVDTDDIDLRWEWISEKLKSAGYVSYWFGKGHTGYKSMQHLPANRGFSSHVGFLAGSGSYTRLPRWDGDAPLVNATHEYSTDLFGRLALEAVQAHDTSSPMFLYLPWQAVHTPYDLPPYCGKSSCPNAIRAMMGDADFHVGRIVEALKSKGMYENTLIVFSADNGGVDSGNNYPLRGEKHTNWNGGMQASAFISGGFVPSRLRGSRNNNTFHVVDLYPTFCRLAGVDAADDAPVPPLAVDESHPERDIYQGNASWPSLDGVDIWDFVLKGTGVTAAHPSLWLSSEVILRDGRWKLVVAQPNPAIMSSKSVNNGWKTKGGLWLNNATTSCGEAYNDRSRFIPCLFDLATDPREDRDLAKVHPDLVASMWAELNRTALSSFTSRTPAEMLGACRKKCAERVWNGAPGPVCGVPGCE